MFGCVHRIFKETHSQVQCLITIVLRFWCSTKYYSWSKQFIHSNLYEQLFIVTYFNDDGAIFQTYHESRVFQNPNDDHV